MAAGNVNLFRQALGDFTKGIKQLQIQRSIQSANLAVQQIRESEAAEQEKNNQVRQIASNLSLDLLGSGAPVATAQFAQQTLAPETLTAFQTAQLGLQQQNLDARVAQAKSQVDLQKSLLELRGEQGIEQIEARGEQARETQQARFEVQAPERAAKRELLQEKRSLAQEKRIKGEIDKFDRRSDVKDLRTAKQSVTSVRNLLASAKDPKAAQFAAAELAKIGLVKASGESGRLSDQDLERAAGNPSAFRSAKRALVKIARGVPLDQDVAETRRLVDTLETALKLQEQRMASSFAKQRGPLTTGISSAELEDSLLVGLGAKDSTAEPGEGGRQFLSPIRQAPQAPPPTATSESRRQKFLTPFRRR